MELERQVPSAALRQVLGGSALHLAFGLLDRRCVAEVEGYGILPWFELDGLAPGEGLVVVARGDHEVVDAGGHAGEGAATVGIGADGGGSVLAQAPRFATLPILIQMKKIWITSVAALNYRLHELELTSDWQYRTLCVQIAKFGYRSREPDEAPREASQILAKVLMALHGEGISRRQIARDLSIRPSELDQLLHGLVFTGIDGGPTGARDKSSLKSSNLTLVK
jgi:hypothetical protein